MSVLQMSVGKCIQLQNLLRSLAGFFHLTFLIKHQLIRNIFIGSKYFYTPFFVNCELATRAGLLLAFDISYSYAAFFAIYGLLLYQTP